MKQSTRRIFFTALAVLFVIAACAPAPAATQDPALIQNQIETSVALTVASQNFETQQAAPVVTEPPLPTDTPAVIDTPTPILPTATPFVIVPPTTVSGGGGGGGGTVVQADYSCNIVSRRPRDYEIFKPGDNFDVKWTIVNTGKKTMIKGLDLKYNSGEKFVGVDSVELPELKPGAQYDVVFDAVAPQANGKYIMTFIVEGGLCYPYAAIEVDKP